MATSYGGYYPGRIGVRRLVERRIILLGKTGSGKSATGNSILGEKKFVSTVSETSVTRSCQYFSKQRHNRSLHIVDTPGAFDTRQSQYAILKEVSKCIGITAPGPHAFLLVINGMSRFTQEEYESVTSFADTFGENVYDFMIVVFTRKDNFLKSNQSTKTFMTRAPERLKLIMKKCDNRYVWFNNRASPNENEVQVRLILDLIDSLDGSYYTNNAFQMAENVMVEKEQEIRDQMRTDILNKLTRQRRQRISTQEEIKRLEQKLSEARNELKAEISSLSKLRERHEYRNNEKKNHVLQEIESLKTERSKLFMSLDGIRKREVDLETRCVHLNDDSCNNRPRDEARKEVESGNESIGMKIMDGLVTVAKYFLIAFAGLLFL